MSESGSAMNSYAWIIHRDKQATRRHPPGLPVVSPFVPSILHQSRGQHGHVNEVAMDAIARMNAAATTVMQRLLWLLRDRTAAPSPSPSASPAEDLAPCVPHVRVLGAAACDPVVCEATQVGLDARRGGGAWRPLGLPRPAGVAPTHILGVTTPVAVTVMAPVSDKRRMQVQATTSAQARMVAVGSSSSSGNGGRKGAQRDDGSVVWRAHGARMSTVRALPRRPVVAAPLDQPSARRTALVKVRYDRSVRVEVKRQAEVDSFNFATDDTQYGGVKLSLTPNKRFSTSLVGRHISLTHSPPTVPTTTASAAALPSDHAQNLPATRQHRAKRAASRNVKKQRLLLSSSSRRSKETSSARAVGQIAPFAQNATAVRTDAEYIWKDKRWTVMTGVETFDHHMSLRVMTRPVRVVPRVQIPLGRRVNGELAPWLSCVHELRSNNGEVQLGWKGMSVATAWAQGLLKVSNRNADGSGFAASVNRRLVAHVDRTVVSKVMRGKLMLTFNGSAGNRKEHTGVAFSLNGCYGTISASVRLPKSCGLVVDSMVQVKQNMYHLGLKMDDMKSASVRLGLFY